MPIGLEHLRDRLLLRSPLVRLFAERTMLGIARLNRALGGRRAGRNVVMFHSGRSGSQVLAGLLAQHRDVFWDNELFWGARQRAYQKLAGENYDPMDIVNLAPYKTRKPWYGWEMKLNHFAQLGLDRAGTIQQLKANGYKHFIVLQRQSLLRQYVSNRLLAAQSDRTRTHVRIDDSVERRQLKVDPEDFLRFAERLDTSFALLRQQLAGEHVLYLTYEEHIEQDPRKAQALVCEFLGLSPLEAQVKLRRGNPFSLAETISNFDALAAALAPTPYGHMLESGSDPRVASRE